MRLSDALIEALVQLQIKHVFGVSGANIEHLHDALNRIGKGRIQGVLAKRECGAANMADGYARTHQKLGVCCATSGGGMVNLLEGVAESYADAVPILAIIGQPPQALEGNGAFQDSSGLQHTVNAEMMCQAQSKYCKKINTAEEFWPALSQAVIAALSPPHGPSILLIPRNLYEQEVTELNEHWASDLLNSLPKKKPQPADIDFLQKALSNAQVPVLILGSGSLWANQQHVIDFIKNNKMAVATTMSAAHAFPNDDPAYLGVVGAAGNPSAHEYINKKADLIVVAGSSLPVMINAPIDEGLKSRPVIFIDEDNSSLPRKFAQCKFIISEIGALFNAINQGRHAQAARATNYLKDYQRTYVQPAWAPDRGDSLPHTEATLSQSQAIVQLSQYLPSHGHLFFDAGNCAAAAMHMLSIPSGCTASIALGMGGMGYALGGAIGAQIGSDKDSQTLAIIGDGAFLMSGFEVHTAVEWHLPILFVIFNNAMHGMCVTRDQLFFAGRIECATYHRVDFMKVAQGLGESDSLWTGRASTELELAHSLKDYFKNADRPGVLDLIIEREEIPPFAPFLPANTATITWPEFTKKSTNHDH